MVREKLIKRMVIALVVTGIYWGLGWTRGVEKKIRLDFRDEIGNRLIVKVRSGTERGKIDTAMRELGGGKVVRLDSLSRRMGRELVIVEIGRGGSIENLIRKLKRNAVVERVERDSVVHADVDPNDPWFGQQWALKNTGQFTGGVADADIDADEAWDEETGEPGVVVACLDSGVDYGHPDLIANLWVNPGETAGDAIDNDSNGFVDDIYGADCRNNDGDPADDNGHGTMVAGVMAARGNNDLGMTGVAWNCRVMAVKFLSEQGAGRVSDLLIALDYVVDQKVNHGQNVVAINASFGGCGYLLSLRDAIQAAGDAGIIYCTSAGNDGDNIDLLPYYPASFHLPNMIVVTGTNHKDEFAGYNYGPNTVDIAAPALHVMGCRMGAYFPQSGDIFFDDMESGSGKWQTGGSPNSWAISDKQEIFENTAHPVPSGTHFWSDSPGTDYAGNSDCWLAVKNNIDLSAHAGTPVYLGFSSAQAIYDQDHGYVEISKDGGLTWAIVADMGGQFQSGYWQNGYYWTIPDVFKTAQFRFRFHFISDSSEEWAGWIIDDIGIGTAVTYGYDYGDGNSMAVPLISGSLALLASHYPDENLTDKLERLLATGDSLDLLAGKCRTGKRLNVDNALNLAQLPPFITGLSQTEELVPRTILTITGRHFGATAGQVIFSLGACKHDAELISWTDTEVVCKAPYTPHNRYSLSVINEFAVPCFNPVTVSTWSAAGQILLSEDFEGGFPPVGWSVQDNLSDGLVWQNSSALDNSNLSGGEGKCATANSNLLNPDGLAMDTELRTPIISLARYFDHVELSFQHYYADAYTRASVDISTDNGSTWTQLAGWQNVSRGPALEIIDLTTYKDQSIQLRWHYQDNGQHGYKWDVDHIQLKGWYDTDDLLSVWSGSGEWLWSPDAGSWFYFFNQSASQIAAGDMDGDGVDDMVGVWGTDIWVRYASSGQWKRLWHGSGLITITCGDINGDDRDDLIGSWTDLGVWVRYSGTETWERLHTTTISIITSGDFNDDKKDDLLGVWPGLGIWLRDSGSESWVKILNETDLLTLTAADLNGDGYADLLGAWTGAADGVWWRNSVSGAWTRVYSSADQIAGGDIDGQGLDDIIGLWPGANGLWVRYQETGSWSRIHSDKPLLFTTGKMR